MQVEVRTRNVQLAEGLRHYAERRLRFAIRRFADRVAAVFINISEVNGMVEEKAKHCRIVAEIRPFGQVSAEETDPDLYAAIEHAAGRLGRLLGSSLEPEKALIPTPALSVARAPRSVAKERPRKRLRMRLRRMVARKQFSGRPKRASRIEHRKR